MPYRPTNVGFCNFIIWLDPEEPECGEAAVEVDDDPRLSGHKYRCQRHKDAATERAKGAADRKRPAATPKDRLNGSEMRALHLLFEKMGPTETLLAIVGHYAAKGGATNDHRWVQLANGYQDLVGVARLLEKP